MMQKIAEMKTLELRLVSISNPPSMGPVVKIGVVVARVPAGVVAVGVVVGDGTELFAFLSFSSVQVAGASPAV